MLRTAPIAPLLLIVFSSTSEASMGDQTILGRVLDPRIQRCGVIVEGDGIVTVRPFIEASSDVYGTLTLRVGKTSNSGTSVSAQTGPVAEGRATDMVIAVNAPARLELSMAIDDARQAPLCRLEERISI